MTGRPKGFQAICVLCGWDSAFFARERTAWEHGEQHVCPLAVTA